MITFNKFTIFLSVLIIILFWGSGCKKEKTSTSNSNEIPVVAFNFSINPNSTEYIELNNPGGSVPLTGGYLGIIVYRVSVNEFVAFERACPYDWNVNNSRVTVDKSGIMAECPTCKSKFILLDGSVFSGPSKYPLKQYNASYDGTILYIYN